MTTNKSSKCRFCKSQLSNVFINLGESPLANSFLEERALQEKEKFYPLKVFVCTNCWLVQLEEFESPEKIFNNYAYFSSYSDTWLEHAKKYVEKMLYHFKFDKNSKIIEIASNDGYLLQYFKQRGIPVLGIEPANNVAQIAKEKGIPTLEKFFGVETAKELVSQKEQADLLIGNNVLAHVPNVNDFIEGLRILLKENGVITIEVPHLLQLMKYNQFDTIYHEHFSYFSLFVVRTILSEHGLSIFDIDILPTHGGSIRIYAKHENCNLFPVSEIIDKIIDEEMKFGLTNLGTYSGFLTKVNSIKNSLCDFIEKEKLQNKKIIGYGAPAKGNTLLNYCNLHSNSIDYVVDRNPHKQGLFLPGTHIPIKNPDEIKKTKPDYLLILPWNLKDEIIQQTSFIRDWGGKYIVPIPELKVIA